jgi:hypothetical protein
LETPLQPLYFRSEYLDDNIGDVSWLSQHELLREKGREMQMRAIGLEKWTKRTTMRVNMDHPICRGTLANKHHINRMMAISITRLAWPGIAGAGTFQKIGKQC